MRFSRYIWFPLLLLICASAMAQPVELDYDYANEPDEETASEEPDVIQQFFLSIFRLVQGDAGDVFAVLGIVAMVYCLVKKRYRGAVAFLVLVTGMVMIRVTIGILFGDL